MHVNHSQINSSKKCGFESHDRTKGFHRKTARQNRSQTNNHHLRQSFIWQLSLCGNYTLIFDPENAPYISKYEFNLHVNQFEDDKATKGSFSNNRYDYDRIGLNWKKSNTDSEISVCFLFIY